MSVSHPSIMEMAKAEVSRRYRRHGLFSRSLDRLNRLPLLRDFTHLYPDVPRFATREAMWNYLADETSGPIDYLEFGVHQGHSLLHWSLANRNPASRFVGFDTFEGLPEHWNQAYPKGHFDMAGQMPSTDDPRVTFVKGLFQDTLGAFLAGYVARPGVRRVVHIDCDLYTSALYCLTKLDSLLETGTIVVFDEFGDVQHEFRAFNDYTTSYRRGAKLICTHDDVFTAAVEML